MNSKIAVLASSLTEKRRPWINAHFGVEANDSAIALSRAEPVRPTDGNTPVCASLLPNESEVYYAPLSE